MVEISSSCTIFGFAILLDLCVPFNHKHYLVQICQGN